MSDIPCRPRLQQIPVPKAAAEKSRQTLASMCTAVSFHNRPRRHSRRQWHALLALDGPLIAFYRNADQRRGKLRFLC